MILLTIATSRSPATLLGVVLGYEPMLAETVELPFGRATVLFPEASEERCTAAIVVESSDDAAGVGDSRSDGLLEDFAAGASESPNAILSIAIARLFPAILGNGSDRSGLAKVILPLEIRISGVRMHRGEQFVRSLYEPLGYEATIVRHAVAGDALPWEESRYATLMLRRDSTVAEALLQVAVLTAALDERMHESIDRRDMNALLRASSGWLSHHPLGQKRVARPASVNVAGPRQDEDGHKDCKREAWPITIAGRHHCVAQAVADHNAGTVVDLGCGEGNLVRELARSPLLARIVGMDVSPRALSIARERLARAGVARDPRVELIQGSLVYRDRRLRAFDAATAVELIEHLDAVHLEQFVRVLFGFMRPRTIVLTTPNAEFNVLFGGPLPGGRFRHPDHRFEWSRAEFRDWAHRTAVRYRYSFEYRPLGCEDAELGPPTQMGVFVRAGA